ncbi:hypothetical protein DPMN_124769 [Dreissena polymorpha]|uniref:Uncharacterized protein n=1 Tax=Dreissena polymorpha TaxID=45954 RepID=A0A9D4GWM5_DREPO|nr:hypothetical protein DPMN_124769 [Dreissena polymorpha]
MKGGEGVYSVRVWWSFSIVVCQMSKFIKEMDFTRKSLKKKEHDLCIRLKVTQHTNADYALLREEAVHKAAIKELLPVDKEGKQHAVGTQSPCAFCEIHRLCIMEKLNRSPCTSIQQDLPNQLCVEAAAQETIEWPALAATESFKTRWMQVKYKFPGTLSLRHIE